MTEQEFKARSAELEDEIKGYEKEIQEVCDTCPLARYSTEPDCYYNAFCDDGRNCKALDELELSKERAMTDLYLLEAEYERGENANSTITM